MASGDKKNTESDDIYDISDKDIRTHVELIRGLKQYSKKTDEQLYELAKKKILRKAKKLQGESKLSEKLDIDFSVEFTNKKDRDLARNLSKKYMQDFEIQTISDKNTLKEIIRSEVIQSRLHKALADTYNKQLEAIPKDSLELIQKNASHILSLKNSLGLNKSKDNKDNYDAYQHLMRRAKIWLKENQGSRTIKCPNCKDFILLKIRTNAWEAQDHPFFKDTFLWNTALFENYYNKNITVDNKFIAEVLETSPDYVDWMIKKRGKGQVRQESSSESLPA